MELVQLSLDKIIQTRSYTAAVLRGENKRFAIYAESALGKLLQKELADERPPRPLTHQLFGYLFAGLEIKLKHVLIHKVEETVFHAKLYLEQNLQDFRHILEIDARPSDALILALMYEVPVYCTREVWNVVIPLDD